MRTYETEDWKWLHDPKFTPAELMQLAFPRPQPKNRVSQVVRDKTQDLRLAALASLHKELAGTDKNVLLSSEYLSSPRKPEKTQAIVDVLKEHVDEVRALMYLRDPVTLISSHYQQRLRTSLPPPDLGSLTPKYRRSIEPWDQTLGRSNVNVRIFDPTRFVDDSLLHDFATQVGLDVDTLPHSVPVANVGLSLEATALLYAYRQRYPQDGASAEDTRQAGNRILVLHSFGTTKLRFGADLIGPVIAAARDEILWAEDRGGRPFPTPKGDGPSAIQSLDDLGLIALDQIEPFHHYLTTRFPAVAQTLAPLPRDPVALIDRLGQAADLGVAPAPTQPKRWYERIFGR